MFSFSMKRWISQCTGGLGIASMLYSALMHFNKDSSQIFGNTMLQLPWLHRDIEPLALGR